MCSKQISVPLIFAAAALTSFSAVRAQALIPISNNSFESPIVNPPDAGATPTYTQSSEQYSSQTATSGGHFFTDVIPYWDVVESDNNTTTGVAGGTAEAYGVDNPVDSEYYGANGVSAAGGTSGVFSNLNVNTDYTFNSLHAANTAETYGYTLADGYQFAYVNLYGHSGYATPVATTFTYDPNDPNAGSTGDSLGNFNAGDNYQLSVAVGVRLSKDQYDYILELTDDGNVVATTGEQLSPASKTGMFALATLDYTATDDGAIGIIIEADSANNPADTGLQPNFDNVQLADLSVPEPASLGLLGATSLGLLIRRRRS